MKCFYAEVSMMSYLKIEGEVLRLNVIVQIEGRRNMRQTGGANHIRFIQRKRSESTIEITLHEFHCEIKNEV